MEKIEGIEKRIAIVNGQMVDVLDEVCSLLKVGRLSNSPLAGQKSLRSANKRLYQMHTLHQEARDLYFTRERILEQTGSYTPDPWYEFWMSLQGSV